MRPPILSSSVASSWCPGALCLHSLDEWLHFLPWVQQYLVREGVDLTGGDLCAACFNISTSAYHLKLSFLAYVVSLKEASRGVRFWSAAYDPTASRAHAARGRLEVRTEQMRLRLTNKRHHHREPTDSAEALKPGTGKGFETVWHRCLTSPVCLQLLRTIL